MAIYSTERPAWDQRHHVPGRVGPAERLKPPCEESAARPSGRDDELQLAEIRHRLANCFQLLNGLINARLRRTEDPESRRHLSWLLDVVTSLGMLQQRLAEHRDDDFGKYLEHVAAFWRRYGADRRIDVEVEADSVVLSSGRSSSLALILHELLTNSFEHAFTSDGGKIRLSLKRVEGACELTVCDTGRGFNPAALPDGRIGLTVVRSLAASLGAAVEIDGRCGTTAHIRLPLLGVKGG